MKKRKIIRFKCPECGKMTMTIKQKEGTNACGKCEISELPANLPQKIVCWNKHCKTEFLGKMYDHPKYTLCPKCRELSKGIEWSYGGRPLAVWHETRRIERVLDAYADEVITCL